MGHPAAMWDSACRAAGELVFIGVSAPLTKLKLVMKFEIAIVHADLERFEAELHGLVKLRQNLEDVSH